MSNPSKILNQHMAEEALLEALRETDLESFEHKLDSLSGERGQAITCLIPKEQLKLQERLGEGSFAVVKRAIWEQLPSGRKLDVAVKLLRDSKSFVGELQQEVEHMHHLNHPNLIKLYGLVFSSQIMMVVELCEGGALLDRLRDSRKPVLLATQLAEFSVQIAKGMAYLEKKRFIHRDLAARNVLLTADEKRVKIGDFGLMRALPDKDEHYVMSGQKKVPFAWCPPESLKRRQFSHASDVWSFGVTLWEMFSFGEEPWCGYRGPEILQRIQGGERLPKTVCFPSSLYQLLLQCWSMEPEQRPRFTALKDLLKEVHLPVAQCRDPQTGEGLLELNVGDDLIVIEGRPDSYWWYGQNIRTRKCGDFHRKSVVLKTRQKDILVSRPIKGSFVHTGHGDARGGQSWGDPGKIDDIYLGNPVLPLIDFGTGAAGVNSSSPLDENATPKIVDSVLSIKSRSLAPPRPTRPPSGGMTSSGGTGTSSGSYPEEDVIGIIQKLPDTFRNQTDRHHGPK